MEPNAEQEQPGKLSAISHCCLDYYFNSAPDEHILTKTLRNDTVYFPLFSII